MELTRHKRPGTLLGTRGLFLASGSAGGRRPERRKHNRDLKPETAQEKPLAPRVAPRALIRGFTVYKFILLHGKNSERPH